MNRLLLTIFLLLNMADLSAKEITDTSGVYLTQDDFVSNRLQYKSYQKIRITSRPFWTNFSLSTDACPIKIKLANGKRISMSVGSFYGFRSYGIKYFYSKQLNEYLAVINDTLPVYLLIREDVHFSNITAFKDDIFLYAKNLEDTLKTLTPENIEKDFSGDSQTKNMLSELLKKNRSQGFDKEMNKKDFFRCKEIISQLVK